MSDPVLGFIDGLDLPDWMPLAPSFVTAGAGSALMCDLRNSDVRDPYIYQLTSATGLYKYHIKNDEWAQMASPALGGTFAAGAGGVYIPSGGPYGTISAGSTTQVTIGTALPSAVGVNQLANRGGGTRGYYIRIIGKSAGGSGLIEEREIIGNTGGTQPIIYLATPLSFTPQNTDGYEFLSGKLILFSAGALAATIIRSKDIATGTVANVTNTNFIATIATDMLLQAMDEQYVPHNRAPGEGLYGIMTATNSAAGTLTGTVAGADSALATNEHRNFQIRIVEDTAIPTAVGQRRKITSHTAGPPAVYTLKTNWAVTPSTTCKYVIELNNDVLAWNGTLQVTYSYAGGFNADAAWSTAAVDGGAANQYANPSAAKAAGAMICPSYGLVLDTPKLARHSFFYFFRGGATATIDLFDIAGAATGAWTAAIAVGGDGQTFTTGSSCCYDPTGNDGRYTYMNQSGLQRMCRFDALNRTLEPWRYLMYPQSTVTAADRMALKLIVSGAVKMTFPLTMRCLGTEFFQVYAFR
jgi:hypothetical protein